MTNTQPLVDAHCHLDLFDNPVDVLNGAEQNAVYTIAVTNVPSVFFHTEALVQGSRYVRPALGLHPELVRTHAGELAKFQSLIHRTRYIGEVGLDYVTPDATNREAQRRIFGAILQSCAEAGNKVITVHSRKAATDVIAAAGERYPGVIILHWFSGTAKELNAAIRCGCYFSVNPSMARSVRGRSLIERMPPERVITETDGPYVRVRGGPVSPTGVQLVLPALAKLWRVEEREVGAMVLNNFRTLLRAPGSAEMIKPFESQPPR